MRGELKTSVALTKVLLDNTTRARSGPQSAVNDNHRANIGPILCVAYTNHALVEDRAMALSTIASIATDFQVLASWLSQSDIDVREEFSPHSYQDLCI